MKLYYTAPTHRCIGALSLSSIYSRLFAISVIHQQHLHSQVGVIVLLKGYFDIIVVVVLVAPRMFLLGFLLAAWTFVYIMLSIVVRIETQAPDLGVIQLVRSSLILGMTAMCTRTYSLDYHSRWFVLR